MAQRKVVKAAPVKKPNKKHGPKRKMFHCWDSTTRLAFGRAGLLTKYYNQESFALACAARGVKSNVNDLWQDFVNSCPTMAEKKEYFKLLDERAAAIAKKVEAKAKKSLTIAKK